MALATIAIWPQSVARAVFGVLDPLWWDILQRGEIKWDNKVLVLPRGKFKWVMTGKDVVIVTRSTDNGFVLTLASETGLDANPIDRERRVCASTPRCTELKESAIRFGNVDARMVEYTDTIESRSIAVIQPTALLVSVQLSADSAKTREDGKVLAGSIIEQLSTKYGTPK